MTQNWDIESAISLYNIDRWGTGYFSINERGNIKILPQQNGASIDMMEVLDDAAEQGLRFPMVLRFQDLLRHRVLGAEKDAESGCGGELGFQKEKGDAARARLDRIGNEVQLVGSPAQRRRHPYCPGRPPPISPHRFRGRSRCRSPSGKARRRASGGQSPRAAENRVLETQVSQSRRHCWPRRCWRCSRRPSGSDTCPTVRHPQGPTAGLRFRQSPR